MLESLFHAKELLAQAYAAVGPVAPFLFPIGAFEIIITAFVIMLKWTVPPQGIHADRGFLGHLERLNMTMSGIAVVLGFVGTYAGLMEVLPALATIVEGNAASGAASNLLAGLKSAFISSMVGLGIGGVVGALNDYLFGLVLPNGDDGGQRVQQSDSDGTHDPSVSSRPTSFASASAGDGAPTRSPQRTSGSTGPEGGGSECAPMEPKTGDSSSRSALHDVIQTVAEMVNSSSDYPSRTAEASASGTNASASNSRGAH